MGNEQSEKWHDLWGRELLLQRSEADCGSWAWSSTQISSWLRLVGLLHNHQFKFWSHVHSELKHDPQNTHTHHPHYSKTNRWRYKQVFDVQVAALVVVAVMWRLDRFGGWQPLSGRGAVAGLSLTCGCFFFASQFTSQSGLLFYHFTPLNQSSTLQWENSRGFRFGGVYKVSTWYFKNYPTQSWNAMSSRGNKPDDVIVWWMKLSDMLFVVNQA